MANIRKEAIAFQPCCHGYDVSSMAESMVSRWSESIYSDVLSPRADGTSGLSFLSQLDACLYEGIPMQDETLTNEAKLWSSRFVHLRVIGKRIQPQVVYIKDAEKLQLPIVNASQMCAKSTSANNNKMTNSASSKKCHSSSSSSNQFPKLNMRYVKHIKPK